MLTSSNKSKLKVMTIVGTRPEIIRLSRTISALDRYFEHTLVHTGQNYDFELNQIFFDDLSIRSPDVFLECAGSTAADTISQVISAADNVFSEFEPDALLILGDTNSSLAAVPAKRRKIPIFHMEAGNRCFDLRVPEEINRKIVDHIADINMPYSDIAREYLLREGIKPEFIVKTGSPMDEVLNFYRGNVEASMVLDSMSLEQFRYFVVSAHREENIDSNKNIREFVEMLECLGDSYDLPIIVSVHPRTRKKINELNLRFHPQVSLQKPLSFSDYIKLQENSKAVLSDSGTITEESSILGFPAINIREAHERPEGMEEGAVMFTGMRSDRILQALSILELQSRGAHRVTSVVKDYIAPNVSEIVARTILSYVDYINRNTWNKMS